MRIFRFYIPIVALALLSVQAAEAGLGDLKKKVKKNKHTLTIADLAPKLSKLPFDLEFEGIKYSHIGAPSYDKFFRSSAKVHGLVALNQMMTESATKNLKKFAMSKASDEAMQENIDGLVGDTPPEEWTVEQNIAVMKMAKEKDKISKDEKKFFVQSAGALAISSAAMVKGLGTTQALVKEGIDLQKNATKLKATRIPAATKGTKTSLENLKEASNKGPVVAEEIKVLTTAFKAMSSD